MHPNLHSEFTFGYATTCSYAAKASLELALLAVRPSLVRAQQGTSRFPGTPGERGRTRRDFQVSLGILARSGARQ